MRRQIRIGVRRAQQCLRAAGRRGNTLHSIHMLVVSSVQRRADTKFSTTGPGLCNFPQTSSDRVLQAGLAMNKIFEVLGKNKKYIEFYHAARVRGRGQTNSIFGN
jgi:hypothetical protein